MGKRKRLSAEKIKDAKKSLAFAKLKNVPSSPRKMRLVADMVRGEEVFKALGLLHFSNKQAATDVENSSSRLSPTGNRRMKRKLKAANSTSKPSLWIVLQC